MSSPYNVYLIRKNLQTQTDVSIYENPELFDTNNDDQDIPNQEQPDFQCRNDQVEKLVAAVQGDDEIVRKKYRLIDDRTRRFRALIQSLKDQIENQRQGLEEEDFEELKNRLIRQLAFKIDPASRHSKRKNLFNHQKYDKPIVVGMANYTSSYAGDDNYLNMLYQSSELDAIYSFNGDLYLSDENVIYYINHIPGQSLNVNKPIPLSNEGEMIGRITLTNSSVKSSALPMGHISDDDKLNCIVKSLGFENEINLKSLISAYDFSFIDVVLSLPRLTQSQAENLLIYLYRYNFLSAFVRSKICQFILYLGGDNSCKPWPELLGRFISILSPEWFQKSSNIIDTLDSKVIINVITTLKELNPVAKFLFCIIVDEFSGMDRGDVVDFVWHLIYSSIFMNKYLGSEKRSLEVRQQLNTFVQLLRAKPPGSNTRTNTTKIINMINNNNNYKVPTTRFNPSSFLQDLFTTHGSDIILILKAIPRTKEEASPLFFPLVLEIMEALERFDETKDQIDSISSEVGVVSSIDTDASITRSDSNRRRAASRSSSRLSRSSRPGYSSNAQKVPSSTRPKRSSNHMSRSQNSNRLPENTESDSQDMDKPLNTSSYSRSSRNRNSSRVNGASNEMRTNSSSMRSHSRNSNSRQGSRKPVQISFSEYEEEEEIYDQ